MKKYFLTPLWFLERDFFKACYVNSERIKFMKLVEYSLFRFRILIKQLSTYKDNKTLIILNSRHINCDQSELGKLKNHWIVGSGIGWFAFFCGRSEGPCLLLLSLNSWIVEIEFWWRQREALKNIFAIELLNFRLPERRTSRELSLNL